jgi:formylglycine-generating enzyme required for sulfatase activity
MRSLRNLLGAGAALALILSLGGPAEAVSIDWVTVGDPGNADDTHGTGFGGVADIYRIGKYEVTNAQYAEFLGAVAATDTNGLYNPNMGDPSSVGHGGITRSGSPGSYAYSTIAGRESMPVNHVSFYDALRFANWLHNGQPTGAQSASTTEDGAYTMIVEDYLSGPTIFRNPGATIFLPSEDEWYKAAYYDAVSTSYFDYPAGTDTPTVCALPGATANTANCGATVRDLADVGSYTDSASPSGTFDQGGNAREWNEAIILGSDPDWSRGLRGGRFDRLGQRLAASFRARDLPTFEGESTGFRVASIPEPSVGLLVMTGMLGLAAWRRRSLH